MTMIATSPSFISSHATASASTLRISATRMERATDLSLLCPALFMHDPYSATATSHSKRPHEQLGPTQQWKRRKEAQQVLHTIDCPPQALLQQPLVTPADVIHLSKATREQIRS